MANYSGPERRKLYGPRREDIRDGTQGRRGYEGNMHGVSERGAEFAVATDRYLHTPWGPPLSPLRRPVARRGILASDTCGGQFDLGVAVGAFVVLVILVAYWVGTRGGA